MPTIIDSLVVALGLDAKPLEQATPKAKKSLKELEDQGNKTEASTKKLSNTTKETSKSFGEATKSVTSFLGVIGSTYAIKAMITDFVETNAALSRLSKNLGVGVSDISAWGQAAEQVGGSASGLQGTMDMLSRAQTQLRLTGESSLIPYFSALGISMADANGNARNVTDELYDMADRFSHIDRTTANNMGRMMGIDQGTMNLLLQGRKELELTIARQKESTAVTKAQAEEAEKLQVKIAEMKQRFTALGNALILQAAPGIEKVLDILLRLGNWVLQNSEAVGDFLKIVAVGLAAIAIAAAPIELVTLAIVALAAGIALLWQDYQTWKRGGDSLIDWGKWEPGITAATKGIHALGEAASWTFDKLATVAGIGKNLINGNKGAAALGVAGLFGKNTNDPTVIAQAASINGAGKPADAAYIQNYFKMRGWSAEQAAGIAANLMSESRGRTGAIGDNGSAYGLAQWHPDRQAAFRAFAGHDIRLSTLDEQLSFVQHELTQGSERGAGTKLRGARTARDAGSIVSQNYERPADVGGEASRRGQLAQSYLGIPGAADTVGMPSPSNVNNSRSITVGEINVITPATDAPGIAKDMGKSMDYIFAAHANTGLN